MNKQRRMLELLAIFIFISCLCALIWNSDPYSPSAEVVPPKQDSALTHINTERPDPDHEKWMEGKSLFKSNCAACHNPMVAQTGPALIGVTKRWEDAGSYRDKSGKQWLYAWIKDWSVPVAAGYPYAVAIKNAYSTEMTRFPSLKDEQIDKILFYIEQGNQSVPVAASH